MWRAEAAAAERDATVIAVVQPGSGARSDRLISMTPEGTRAMYSLRLPDRGHPCAVMRLAEWDDVPPSRTAHRVIGVGGEGGAAVLLSVRVLGPFSFARLMVGRTCVASCAPSPDSPDASAASLMRPFLDGLPLPALGAGTASGADFRLQVHAWPSADGEPATGLLVRTAPLTWQAARELVVGLHGSREDVLVLRHADDPRRIFDFDATDGLTERPIAHAWRTRDGLTVD
jgi:hypothetical protein